MTNIAQQFCRKTLPALCALLAAGLTYAAQAACVTPPAGLVGWWQGEGNANDFAGTNHGTLSASGATYFGGKVGQGFRFDGTNGYVAIPDSAALKPANVTLEAWVWLDPNATIIPSDPAEAIIFKRNSWTYLFEGYSLGKYPFDNGNGTSSNRFLFVITSGGNQVIISSSTVVQRGVWYHVAATYDGNKSTLYVNGVAEASAVAGFALDYGTLPVYIGSTGEASPYRGMFAGIIDEPSIYNRSLTTNEIAAIYNAGTAGKCTSALVAPTITSQPTNLTVALNGSGTFTVTAQGTAPLFYQWKKNGTSLFARTNASLTLTNIQLSQAGNYSVQVSNLVGTVTSSNAALAVVSPPCTSTPSGLAAWWPGEGNVNDLINGNNGSIVGTLGYTNGTVGQAMVFDGSSYVAIPASSSLNIGAPGSGVTIEGWIKPGGGGVGMPVVEWSSPSAIGLHLWVEAGYRLFANVMDTSNVSHTLISANNAVSANSFQHVALTYDKSSGQAVLYLNGAQLVAQNIGKQPVAGFDP